jgi:hypothetical protein
MSWPRIVCPDHKGLLQTLRGREVAVKVNDAGDAASAALRVRESGNELFCVIIQSRLPLDAVEFGEDQKGIPMALMAPSVGKFRDLTRQLDLLRELNLRVYLPCDSAQNLAGMRVLSSVGIQTCAVFGRGRMDWESLADLMTYAVLVQAPHAPVEPFAFIVSHYDPFSHLDWGSVYFDDPRRYLHVNGKGRVALSQSELARRSFVAEGVAAIGVPEDFPPVRERTQAWRRFFIDNHPCASCGGFKLCQGRFAGDASRGQGCSAFFLELMEVARQHKDRQPPSEESGTWQP